MRFYIRKDDLIRVYQGCDLGDSVSVPVYMYPHRSMTMELLTCETAVDFNPAEETRNVVQGVSECGCKLGVRGKNCADYHPVETRRLIAQTQDIGKKDD